MSKLVVISEPFLDISNNGTRNNALNKILEAYTNYFDKVVCIVPSNNQIEEKFENGNIRYYSVKGYEKALFKRMLFLLSRKEMEQKIIQIITNEKPDIIQLRIPSIFTQLLFPVLKDTGIPITSYIAGEWDEALKLNYNKIPFITYISNILFKSQRKIIANSIPICTGDRLKNRVLKYNPDSYAYYSTTHEKVHRRVLSDRFYNLMIVCRLEKLKRVQDAIIALYFLNKKDNNNYKLSILGEGVEKDNLAGLVRKLKLNKSVSFFGHINNKTDLEKIYLKNDILIHTSLSEGTTKVLPEAMSFGLLPIAVKGVGSNDYILSDKRGILVNPKSPEEIADEIIKFNNISSDKKKEYIDNGYKYADEHSLEKELDKMWKFIFTKVDKA